MGGAFGVLVLSFILGYLIFASMAAAMGSLVSRQEDLNGVMTPLTIVMTMVYLVAYTAAFDPTGPLASALVYVPPFSVMILPVAAVQGELGLATFAASVAAAVALAGLILWVSSVIYRRTVLRSGARLKLTEVFKS